MRQGDVFVKKQGFLGASKDPKPQRHRRQKQTKPPGKARSGFVFRRDGGRGDGSGRHKVRISKRPGDGTMLTVRGPPLSKTAPEPRQNQGRNGLAGAFLVPFPSATCAFSCAECPCGKSGLTFQQFPFSLAFFASWRCNLSCGGQAGSHLYSRRCYRLFYVLEWMQYAVVAPLSLCPVCMPHKAVRD